MRSMLMICGTAFLVTIVVTPANEPQKPPPRKRLPFVPKENFAGAPTTNLIHQLPSSQGSQVMLLWFCSVSLESEEAKALQLRLVQEIRWECHKRGIPLPELNVVAGNYPVGYDKTWTPPVEELRKGYLFLLGTRIAVQTPAGQSVPTRLAISAPQEMMKSEHDISAYFANHLALSDIDDGTAGEIESSSGYSWVQPVLGLIMLLAAGNLLWNFSTSMLSFSMTRIQKLINTVSR